MQVTTGNKNGAVKTTGFRLQCRATGLFMADATSDFQVIAVTYRKDRAFAFPCADAAEHGRKIVRALYGSFDWQPVTVEG